MTDAQLVRAAEQQRIAQAQHRAEVRHTDLPYIRAAATARATRVGPGPDRPKVHGAG